ncbi:MerR family transcriptional regulator [Micrococcus sp. FDAARGOS_333]|uniref:MerR family transcriptional regulator n=1 Tax=Micrococcus sp. FDAARGOS_333 TaxID=1930558 RepID=UPI000B4DF9B8|nr:MerR family transcriptional regulator [Micrococcus sp. FDAARGOS_333]PNL16867.1 MerR family transcriptional regulator [Micrococcus sp. FDAARGOS_333]
MTEKQLTVGEVAELTGVTVRTLHHYDRLGLVRPARTSAGYRLYGPADVARLQEVVAYRRLGFGLDEIPGPTTDRRLALERQHDDVVARIDELRRLERALETALAEEDEEKAGAMRGAERKEDTMSDDVKKDDAMGDDVKKEDAMGDAERKELYGDLFGSEYAEEFEDYQEEAEQRWGETDAWAQSQQRTKKYSKQDWERIKAEMDDANALILGAMQDGEPADSVRAMDAAEAARAHMSRWYFDVSPAMHRNLGDMYVADPRFAKNYEDLAPGLAAYLRDAIHANADRLEA